MANQNWKPNRYARSTNDSESTLTLGTGPTLRRYKPSYVNHQTLQMMLASPTHSTTGQEETRLYLAMCG